MKWLKEKQADILLYGFMIAGVGFLMWLFAWMSFFSPLAKGLRAMGY